MQDHVITSQTADFISTVNLAVSAHVHLIGATSKSYDVHSDATASHIVTLAHHSVTNPTLGLGSAVNVAFSHAHFDDAQKSAPDFFIPEIPTTTFFKFTTSQRYTYQFNRKAIPKMFSSSALVTFPSHL